VFKQSTNGYEKRLGSESVVQICPHIGKYITCICRFACQSIILFTGLTIRFSQACFGLVEDLSFEGATLLCSGDQN